MPEKGDGGNGDNRSVRSAAAAAGVVVASAVRRAATGPVGREGAWPAGGGARRGKGGARGGGEGLTARAAYRETGKHATVDKITSVGRGKGGKTFGGGGSEQRPGGNGCTKESSMAKWVRLPSRFPNLHG